jgi:putative restriction endonuclease
MRGYVGVTDQQWYEFLRAHPEQNEVNFWRPRDKNRFGAIEPGEFFFFKQRARFGGRVVGGGIFEGWQLLPLTAAWEDFGFGNGGASLADFRALIGTHASLDSRDDPEIGCILLRDVVFFPADAIAAPPPEFARNLVQGRSYDIDDPRYGGYFDLVSAQVLSGGITLELVPWSHGGPTMSDPRLRRERLGQGGFRAAVLNAYHRRCAITGTKIWPALDAAHIRPVDQGGEHRLDNGLLLRSDVHKMFDKGFLGVDAEHKLIVSPRLRTEFGNGEKFYAMAGELIALPDRRVDHPSREFLEWHMDEVFIA